MIVVRQAGPDDLPFLKQMLYQAANRPNTVWPPFEHKMAEPRVQRFWLGWQRSGDIGVIAEDGGVQAGAAWLRRFTPEERLDGEPDIPVVAIAVEESYRGSGVGKALLRRLTQYARQVGIQSLRLTTGVFNEAALNLYRQHGFVEVSREGDSVEMVAQLPSSPEPENRRPQ